MKSKHRYKRRKRYLKGRRLQNYVRDKLLKTFPHLRKRDVSVALAGQQGPDIILSRTGKKLVGSPSILFIDTKYTCEPLPLTEICHGKGKSLTHSVQLN